MNKDKEEQHQQQNEGVQMSIPLASHFQPVCGVSDESNTSISNEEVYLTANEQSSIASTNQESSLASRPNSLTASVQLLNTIIEKKLHELDEKLQEYEMDHAQLQKGFTEQVVELKKSLIEKDNELKNAKLMYEAKISELQIQMEQIVEETKKKKWCHHCWKELTFNCTIDPPACSTECLDALL